MDVVLLFPGQGSQKVGMGKDLAEASSEARKVYDEVDSATGTTLSSLAWSGPVEELVLTHNAQPALLTHSAAVWAMVKDVLSPYVRAAAGHSLGEFSAYHAAGSLTLHDAAKLVRRRGELMFEAGVSRPGSMAAILGNLSTPIEEICEKASEESGLVVPANFNGADQIVISGESTGIEKAMELCKEAGARRCVLLPVSGAFHSPLMEPAADGLSSALSSINVSNPNFPVFANVNAEPVNSGSEAAALLIKQLTSPVRWTAVMSNIAKSYPDAVYVEMGTGSVLSSLAKRLVPGAKIVQAGTILEVEALMEMCVKGKDSNED